MKWCKLLFMLVAFSLVGCNGDKAPNDNATGGDITPPTVEPYDGSLKAMDLSLSAPLRKTTLSLKPYTWSKEHKTLSLVSVKSLSKDPSKGCVVTEQKPEQLTFETTLSQLGVCLFRYTVTDQKQQASGMLRLVASPNATGTRLMPLPVGSELGDVSKSVSLGDTLSFDLSTAPEIVGDVIAMTNPRFSETTLTYGNGTAELTEEGQFTFKAIATGFTEVTYYILDDQNTIDDTRDDEVYVGRVLISVSGTTNTPPTADDGVIPTPLKLGEMIEIDVADFADGGSLIEDGDADPVQLVYVQSDGAFVELSKPNDVTNTKFKLQAPTTSTPGEGYTETIVHYAVYDHNEDGVAQGNIRVSFGKKLTSIAIMPAEPAVYGTSDLAIAKGRHQAFTAMGTFDDGSTEEMTRKVLWDSATTSVASIDSTGIARGLSVGHTDISASTTTLEGKPLNSNVIDLEVTDAALLNFWLTPSHQTLPNGTVGDITAVGRYSDGTTATISDAVTWEVTPSDIVSIDNTLTGPFHPTAEVHADAEGEATVSATLDGLSSQNTATVNVTKAVVTALQLTNKDTTSPSSVTMTAGESALLEANAFYSDGSRKDVTDNILVRWESANDDIAAFTAPIMHSNQIQGMSEGKTTVTATFERVTSNSLSVNVSAAKLVSIQVTPPSMEVYVGGRGQLTATGTYSDGKTRNITTFATWEASTNAVTQIRHGAFFGANEGFADIWAKLDGVLSSNRAHITITPAKVKEVHITTTPDPVEIIEGMSHSLEAEAVYTDGNRRDITGEAAWSTASPSIASITSPGGVVTADLNSGGATTTATVTLDGESDSIGIKVIDAVITSIDVTPKDLMLPHLVTQQYTAMATYSNSTSANITRDPDSHWSIDDSNLGTFDDNGLLTVGSDRVGEGTVKIENSGIVGNTGVQVVSATLESIDVTPESVTLEKDETANLTATGSYNNGTTEIITNMVDWIEHNPTIATVESKTTNAGRVTGVTPGTTHTIASLEGVESNEVPIDVVAPKLVSIEVTPIETFLGSRKQIKQLTATGVYDIGPDEDLTELVDWSIGDETVATVSNIGEVTPATASEGVDEGETVVTAEMDDLSSTAQVKVCIVGENCIDIYSPNDDDVLFTSTLSSNYNFNHDLGLRSPIISDDGAEVYQWHVEGVSEYSSAFDVCEAYNSKALGDRTNWRLPEISELEYLYESHGPIERGWPINRLNYISSTLNSAGTQYRTINLGSGEYSNINPDSVGYVSCISEP